MDYSEFKCKWIDPASLCNIADETRNKYWPESKLPVNTEEMELYVKLGETGRLGGYGRKGCTILGEHASPGNDLVFSGVS